MTERRAMGLLWTVGLAWGAAATLMKIGIGDLSPFSLIALRFGIAFVVMCLLFFRRVRRVNREILLGGLAMGTALFLTFTCMLLALERTTASAAGFLTGCAVVLVPLLELAVFRRKPAGRVWISMALVVAGIGVMSLNQQLSLDAGTLYCLACAFFNAVYIVLTGHLSRRMDAFLLGVWQLAATAVLGLLAALFTRTWRLPITAKGWGCVLALALLCSAYGYVVQPMAQRHTSSERTGFILSSEPVFSLLWAGLLLGERFTVRQGVGAALIFASILVVSGAGGKKKPKNPECSENAPAS